MTNINQAVNKLLGEAEEESLYHQLLELVENMKVKDAPRGAMDFIDFLAQIYNGGVLQYVQNGYAESFVDVARFLNQYGGEELVEKYNSLDPEPTMETIERIGEEGDIEEATKAWDEFETWIYDKKNTDPILTTIIDNLKKKTVKEDVSLDDLESGGKHREAEIGATEALYKALAEIVDAMELNVGDVRGTKKAITLSLPARLCAESERAVNYAEKVFGDKLQR
jgi:hypothetical protein